MAAQIVFVALMVVVLLGLMIYGIFTEGRRR